jgi:hypothetical protein
MRKTTGATARPRGYIAFHDNEVHRRNPAANALLEMIPIDSPDFAVAMRELAALRTYGIELTPELATKVAAKVIARRRPELVAAESAAMVASTQPGQVVYYARMGNRIKIGTSANVARRMKEINPEELMAVEPGGHALEHCRHIQFEHLHTHSEWFRHEADLASHIAALKDPERIPWPRSSIPPR